jgi:2-methylcitrate dehydratase PrpD
MPQAPEYLQRLAVFAAEAPLAAMPEAVRARARAILADCLPVVGTGMRVPQMRAFARAFLAGAGEGHAWVVGAGRRARAAEAAFLNGTAGTWLELNEGNLHARGHPSVQVVPAALALAQERHASGADLLASIIVGYEVCARIARAANVKLSVHPHGTWGVIGAAVAAGRLKGFAPAQMVALVNMAATLGLATSRTTLLEGATVRNPFSGHSGHMGIVATQMLEAGFTGQSDGPGAIYSGVLSEVFEPARAVERLGEDWLITKGYLKLNPTGRYVHAAFDALDDALARVTDGKLDPGAIERIDVRAYQLAAMLNGQTIASSFGARFSIPFALATRLYHGHAWLEAFEEAAVANPAVRALAQRIFISEDPAHTAAYPAVQRCDLIVRLRGGTTLSGHCEVMRGEPERPHSAEALRNKFFTLAVPLWGEATARRMYDACLDIESIADCGAFAAAHAL